MSKQEEKPKHTPLPWEVRYEGPAPEILGALMPVVNWQGFDDSDCDVAEHQANAALIVTAVNSHHDLLAALKRFVEILPLDSLGAKEKFGPDADIDTLYCDAMEAAEKAIIKAEAK